MSLFQIDRAVKTAMRKADQIHYFRTQGKNEMFGIKTIHIKKEGVILMTLKAETWIDREDERFTTSLIEIANGAWGALYALCKAGDELLIYMNTYPVYGTTKRVKELCCSLYRNDKPVVRGLVIEQEFINE